MEHYAQEMKISSAKVRRFRSEHGWSQDQLALASGLSLRTIQRVEAEGNASRETHVCLAATFGISLAELSDEVLPDNPRAVQSILTIALPARYKVTGVLTGLMLIPVLLKFAEVIPAALDPYVSLAFMAMIALFIYSGFGWYFSGAVKNPSHSKRAAQILFIATAVFCGFASLAQGNRAELTVAAQIALLAVFIYFTADTFLMVRQRK
ncbi:helix-turn-helix domain-containing protein [Cellvibrio sp.]